jgi:hypothetical protein
VVGLQATSRAMGRERLHSRLGGRRGFAGNSRGRGMSGREVADVEEQPDETRRASRKLEPLRLQYIYRDEKVFRFWTNENDRYSNF